MSNLTIRPFSLAQHLLNRIAAFMASQSQVSVAESEQIISDTDFFSATTSTWRTIGQERDISPDMVEGVQSLVLTDLLAVLGNDVTGMERAYPGARSLKDLLEACLKDWRSVKAYVDAELERQEVERAKDPKGEKTGTGKIDSSLQRLLEASTAVPRPIVHLAGYQKRKANLKDQKMAYASIRSYVGKFSTMTKKWEAICNKYSSHHTIAKRGATVEHPFRRNQASFLTQPGFVYIKPVRENTIDYLRGYNMPTKVGVGHNVHTFFHELCVLLDTTDVRGLTELATEISPDERNIARDTRTLKQIEMRLKKIAGMRVFLILNPIIALTQAHLAMCTETETFSMIAEAYSTPQTFANRAKNQAHIMALPVGAAAANFLSELPAGGKCKIGSTTLDAVHTDEEPVLPSASDSHVIELVTKYFKNQANMITWVHALMLSPEILDLYTTGAAFFNTGRITTITPKSDYRQYPYYVVEYSRFKNGAPSKLSDLEQSFLLPAHFNKRGAYTQTNILSSDAPVAQIFAPYSQKDLTMTEVIAARETANANVDGKAITLSDHLNLQTPWVFVPFKFAYPEHGSVAMEHRMLVYGPGELCPFMTPTETPFTPMANRKKVEYEYPLLLKTGYEVDDLQTKRSWDESTKPTTLEDGKLHVHLNISLDSLKKGKNNEFLARFLNTDKSAYDVASYVQSKWYQESSAGIFFYFTSPYGDSALVIRDYVVQSGMSFGGGTDTYYAANVWKSYAMMNRIAAALPREADLSIEAAMSEVSSPWDASQSVKTVGVVAITLSSGRG